MRIRHIVAADNVNAEGWVREATAARHAVLVGGRVADVSGPVEATTHLNRDFPDHRLDACVVVESLAVGARVVIDDEAEGFAVAWVPPGAFRSLGRVNVGARREAWQRVRATATAATVTAAAGATPEAAP